MGAKTDDLQREVAYRRGVLDYRMNNLRDRIGRDAESAREALAGDVRELERRVDGAPGTGKLRDQVEAHPLASVAAGAAAGFALGAMTGRPAGRGSPQPAQSNAAEGFLASTFGTIASALSGALRDQARTIVDEVTGKGSDEQGDGSFAGDLSTTEPVQASSPPMYDGHLTPVGRGDPSDGRQQA